tara:strand:+ start:2530 stop:2997 length:468 start_codon:yes stop_codon:yes gene_type:complete
MSETVPTFENNDNIPFDNNERPVLLKVLCILSWIGSGVQIFVSTLYSLFITGAVKQEMYNILPNQEIIDMYKDIFNLMDKTSIWYLILYIGNVAFVYMMWNFKMMGFYGYALIQVLILLVPYIVNPFNFNQLLVSSIFPVIFIILYSRNLKYFKN